MRKRSIPVGVMRLTAGSSVLGCGDIGWASTVIFGITFACFWGFQYVKPGFFPGTNIPLFFIDYYLPQGTDIHTTSREVEELEAHCRLDNGV